MTRTLRPRRMFGALAAVATAAMLSTMLTATVASASTPGRPAHYQDKPVPGHSAGKRSDIGAARSSTSAKPAVLDLPTPGVFHVHLTGAPVTGHHDTTLNADRKTVATVTGAWSALGHSGVAIAAAATAPTAQAPAQSVDATVLSAAQDKALGVSGPALRLSRPGSAKTAPVAVRIPNAMLAGRFGADYASRVRWVQVPAAASSSLRGPVVAADATTAARGGVTVQPVAQGDDTAAKATVVSPLVGQNAVILTAAASPVSSTGTGNFTATPLNAASSWAVSAQTGGFSWQYPMTAPPAAAGPAPQVSLSYNSQEIDGETGASNNQPSAVGDGWSLNGGGFIERDYVPCSQDDGAGGPVTTSGDLCWKTDNATLSLGGQAGQLIEASDGTWHLQGDDGSRIQHLVGTAAGCAANGTYDTDCWLLTTRDGTKYYFGLNRLPGWATGDATTNSAWTVPVFGNDPGEPCHASTFAASSCMQAWRWNLDYVVDVHHNAEALYYTAETNKYARDGATTVSYTRGGQLARIDYGFVAGQAYAANAASDRVVFGYDPYGRCSDASHSTCTSEPLTSAATMPAHPTSYPDVPFDQYCTATTCTEPSPTFFTDAMLDTVTTQVLSGSAYANVDVWTLGHSFPAPGDGTSPALWLTGITHTGYSGTTSLKEPATTFVGAPMHNRVWVVDGLAPLDKYRITSINTSLGAVISVAYAPTDPACTPANAASIEANAATNTHLCFPQWWTPQVVPPQAAQLDLFFKYVVASVTVDPRTGGGYDRPQQTDYVYTGTPAWRYNTSLTIPTKQHTWNVFAGFSTVEVRVGDPSTPTTQQATDYTFFQGMDGDPSNTSGGTKSVYVTGSTTVKDSLWLAGQVREQKVLDGVGGAVVSDTVNTPWASAPTAGTGITAARYVGDGTSVDTEPVSTGGTRTVTTMTGHDPATGLPTTVQTDRSDTGTSTCTTTSYAPSNTTAWLVGLPDEVATVATTCADVGTATYPGDAISDVRTSYDNAAWGATPTVGDATQTQIVDSYTGTTAATAHWVTQTATGYDSAGRVTSATDILGHTTTTAYAPAATATAVRPPTSVTTTNPAGWASTVTYDPTRGLETSATDQNGMVTTATYDALGRRTAVWLPGRPQASYATSPSIGYAYTLSQTSPNAIATTTLTASGTTTSFTLFDGSGRQVQSQSPAEGGGSSVTDTAYNAAGQVSMTDGPYWAASVNPSAALFVPTSLQQVTPVTNTSYDGAGRVTKTELQAAGTERSETDTAYLGADRTDTTPPAGGTPTSSFTNSLGQQTRLTQYLDAATPTGTSQTTTYTYNPAGHMATMTDPDGNTWSWAYDVLGQQTKATDPDTGTTTTSYDDAGDVLSTTDARGDTISYSYDTLQRKTAEYSGSVSGGSMLASWTYDTLEKGQLTSSTSYTGSVPGTPGLAYTDTITGYDDAYQPTGETVSIPTGAPAFGGTSYTTRTLYNPDGSVSAQVLPAEGGLPQEIVRYGYDGLGRASGLSGYAVYGSALWTATGQLSQTATDGSTSLYDDYSYDPATGLTVGVESSTVTGTTSTVVADRQYTRNNAGDVTQAVTTGAGQATDTQCFRYDGVAELTAAWTPASGSCTAAPDASALGGPAPYLEQYTYDPATGNRLTATVADGSAVSQATYAYPAAGQAHPDAVGKVTQTGTGPGVGAGSYGYDADGNMTAAPGGVSMSYDPAGLLTGTTGGAGATGDVYDASGTLLMSTGPSGARLFLGATEIDSAAAGVSAVRTYSLAGQVIARRATSPGVSGQGALTWVGSDVDGTPDVQVDPATGAVTRNWSDPFGVARGAVSGSWPAGYGFLDGPVDATTGLTVLGARWYDPTLGRFTTVDPVLAPDNPVQDNGYAYSGNNPVTFTDPSGACFLGPDYQMACARPAAASTPDSTPGPVASAPHFRWPLPFVGQAPAAPGVSTYRATPAVYHHATTPDRATRHTNGGGWNWGLTALIAGGVLLTAGIVTCAVVTFGTCLAAAGTALGIGGEAGADISGAAADAAAESGQSLSEMFSDATPKASDLSRYAEERGWAPSQSENGPLKYTDENGIVRMTIKRGSLRAPGSEGPHVELRGPGGGRIDPEGNSVTRRSPGNHTPIEWDQP